LHSTTAVTATVTQHQCNALASTNRYLTANSFIFHVITGQVVVDNRAWAVAKLGIINTNLDIFRAEACYKGGIGYDLNILKDFGIDNIVEVR